VAFWPLRAVFWPLRRGVLAASPRPPGRFARAFWPLRKGRSGRFAKGVLVVRHNAATP
jgi:hypothetical protein